MKHEDDRKSSEQTSVSYIQIEELIELKKKQPMELALRYLGIWNYNHPKKSFLKI